MVTQISPVEQKEIQKIAEALKGVPPLKIELDPMVAISIIAELQLALRCSLNTGVPAQHARQIIRGLTSCLPKEVYPLIQGF